MSWSIGEVPELRETLRNTLVAVLGVRHGPIFPHYDGEFRPVVATMGLSGANSRRWMALAGCDSAQCLAWSGVELGRDLKQPLGRVHGQVGGG